MPEKVKDVGRDRNCKQKASKMPEMRKIISEIL